ncbi:sugar transporter ESL [Salix suchowensis]|nr:sugar transporter ESL [Salix suchowensis]
MAGDGIEEGLESSSSPLLPGEKSTSSSATRNQHSITPVGYSSPAESGIMEDLGLSVSAVGEGLILLQTFGGNSAVSYYLGTIFAKASKCFNLFWTYNFCSVTDSNIYCNCAVNGFIRKTDTSYGLSYHIMLMLVSCRIIVLLPGIPQSERAHSNIDFGWHIGFWHRFHHRHVRNTLGYNGRDISCKCKGISRKPSGSNQLG